MSRIGRLPVAIPKGVQVKLEGRQIRVKGPKGELAHEFPSVVEVAVEDGQVVVKRESDERHVRALHGTTRALINNMVVGVSQGFNKSLQVEGVGYRAELKGKKLVFNLGFSHSIEVDPPAGIAFATDEKAKTVTVSGYDRALVGQVAANIRRLRPPEPYKGKGIRYLGEHVRRKAGKAGKVS